MIFQKHSSGETGQRSTLLLVLLLVALVLVDLAAIAPAPVGDWTEQYFWLTWALLVSQMVFLGIWLLWGRGWLPLRAVGALAAASLWAVVVSQLEPNPFETYLSYGTGVALAATFWGWLPFRAMGYGVVWRGRGASQTHSVASQPEKSAVPPSSSNGGQRSQRHAALGPRQFTILYLFGWMTSLAVICAAFKTLINDLPALLVPWMDYPVVIHTLFQALTCCALLWLVLDRPRWLAFKFVVVIISASAETALLCRHLTYDPRDWWWAEFVSCKTALLAGYLLVWRVAGARLAASEPNAAA